MRRGSKIVHFRESDSGGVGYTTHDRGVITRWQVYDHRRFPWVTRRETASANSGNLAVTFSGTSAGPLMGQQVRIINNFDNVADQLLQFTGTAYRYANPSAHTPEPVIKRLYDATKVSLADPEVRQKLIAGGNNIVGNNTAEFRAFLDEESRKWGGVVRAGNIKLDE